jgi:CGNR zinc finger protein
MSTSPSGRRFQRIWGVGDLPGEQGRGAGVTDPGPAGPPGGNVAGLGEFEDGAPVAGIRHRETDGQISWTLRVPEERLLAVRAVLAWDALARHSPGRLRPCANDECRLFLIDRSKANTARRCSMAACGNRMKARRHYQRATADRR